MQPSNKGAPPWAPSCRLYAPHQSSVSCIQIVGLCCGQHKSPVPCGIVTPMECHPLLHPNSCLNIPFRPAITDIPAVCTITGTMQRTYSHVNGQSCQPSWILIWILNSFPVPLPAELPPTGNLPRDFYRDRREFCSHLSTTVLIETGLIGLRQPGTLTTARLAYDSRAPLLRPACLRQPCTLTTARLAYDSRAPFPRPSALTIASRPSHGRQPLPPPATLPTASLPYHTLPRPAAFTMAGSP